MSYNGLAEGGLNYFPCRYGTSKLLFRGPKRRMDRPYVAVVGGTEAYGKFVEQPFPDLLEGHVGLPIVNFGAVNAGIDVFSCDETVMSACSGARAVVLQAMGAHNLRNRFYSVHQRRNDRFLRASALLSTLYPEVDFTEFAFTRHLIQSLHATDPDRFIAVREELQAAWLGRMNSFLDGVRAPVVLLWMAERRPEAPSDLHRASDPLFVTRDLVDAIRPRLAGVVEAVPSDAARAAGGRGLVCTDLEAPAAAEVPNPAVHAETAAALALGLRTLI
ncbi:MAG: DUF6473 family protein [Rhodobacteraceae bacterium]|jgi:hypothetical protein|nr:DUF6473 family protein [Paracoccaceae bacterium]